MQKWQPHLVDKELVASCFKTSAATYEENAIVQKEISRQLIALLQRYEQISYKRVLEVGCCTGNLTHILSDSLSIGVIYVNDLIAEFCNVTKNRIDELVGRVITLPGDIEKNILPPNLDLVISSSTFQWMVDLPGLLKNLAKVLNPTGHLAFSIFSPGTMEEISSLSGRGLTYHTNDQLVEMLINHFQVLSIHSETRRLYFPSFRAVLRHIRQTGVGGVESSRWSLGKLKEFERRYLARYLSEDGLPVTYVATFVLAQKMTGEIL